MSNITAVTPFALTAKGHALQLKVQAGLCKLELVGIKIGDGYLQEGQTIESLTDLVHEIPTADGSEETQSPIAALGEVYKDKDTKGRERVMVHVYIRNGDNESTRITECAIRAKDTDGSTIIYGAINLGGSSMPFDQYNGTTPIVYNWKFPLYVSNEANINMSYGFVAGVSREDFEALEKKKANINSPEFTGEPQAPTAPYGDKSYKIANTTFVNNILMTVLGNAEYVDIEVLRVENGEGESDSFQAVRILNVHYENIDIKWDGPPDDLSQKESYEFPQSALVITSYEGALITGLEWYGNGETLPKRCQRFTHYEILDTAAQYGGNEVHRLYI